MSVDRWIKLGVSLTLVAVCACNGPDTGQSKLKVPPSDDFQGVGDVLAGRCGTLDCHGQDVRNLRVYGTNGLRLSGISGIGATTDQEYQATYDAVIEIEPEILSQVFREHREPERLTLIRKARGTEQHKGNTVIQEGDPADRCLTAWLTGHTPDAMACSQGADLEPPIKLP